MGTADKASSGEADVPVPAGFEVLKTLAADALPEAVQEVRATGRLKDAPCRIVSPAGSMSAFLEKAYQDQQPGMMPSVKRILELNPRHPLVERLCQLTGNPEQADFVKRAVAQLHDNALLIEGFVPDPQAIAQRTQALLEELAGEKKTIIT